MTETEKLAARLADRNPAVRIAALRGLEQSTADLDWSLVDSYFQEFATSHQQREIDEILAAIDLAIQAPSPEAHDLVTELASSADHSEAAHAAMALARAGENVSSLLVSLLAAATGEGARRALAEHLLLTDVGNLVPDIEKVLKTEEDAETRFWLASALNQAGNSGPLRHELEGTGVPDELRSLVRVERFVIETDSSDIDQEITSRLSVKPRVTEIQRDSESGVGEVYVTFDEDLLTLSRPPEAGPVEVRGGGGGGGDEPTQGEIADETRAPRPRYFEALAPNAVKLGDTIGIQVRMAIEQTVGAVAKAVELDVPDEGLTLSLTTHLPGFQLVSGTQFRELSVPAQDDSEWVLYQLRAMHEGLHELIFTAFHPEGRMVAELVIQISVDAVQETTTTREVRATAGSIEGDVGEVSLTVDWVEDQESYRFQLMDRTYPDAVISERLKRTPRDIVESLIAELDQLASNTPTAGQNTRQRLRDRGIQLWSEFIPETLKAQFWERQSRIKSLRIFARDDPVPWELLYPLAPGHDAGFLVEQFPVVRSIRGAQPIARIGPGSLEAVLPAVNAPTSARDEIAAVKACWASRAGGPLLSDLSSLRRVLDEASFGILHLACHNAFDPADANRSTITFRDQAFNPPVLAPMIATRSLTNAAPLIFMNACRSAGKAPLYTALSGWASSFIKAGAAAFIGSNWAVRDSSSKSFAETFYAQLASGSNLADSLIAARREIASDDDPTWLAYTAYGDTRTTI